MMEYLHRAELLHLYSLSLHLNNQLTDSIVDQSAETVIQFYFTCTVASIEAIEKCKVTTIISVYTAWLYIMCD